MHATATANATTDSLAWPVLNAPEGPAQKPLALSDSAHAVCAELERRLRALDAFRLPAHVAQDVDEMARDLDELQGLLPADADTTAAPARAQRLLADLRAWMPVCEVWIGVHQVGPRPWPMLQS
jgi:hypothetical protein